MQLTLHHVRDLVKRRGRLSSRDGTSRRSSSREIPTGILLHILSFVSRQDLLAISRASKRLNAVADIALYSSIKIGANSSKWFRENRIPLDEHSQAALYRTIRAPRFTTLVTEFRVDFSWCSSRNVTFSNKVPKNQCTCDELDQLLGQALVSLKNLRLLHFFCICCEDPSDKRHLYLQDLRAECLENLAFECQCMPVTSSKPFRILSAPCMRSVTSLKWEALGNVEPDASMRSILEDKECLPKLKTLIFRENLEAVAPLISKSQLEYIQCSTLDERLQGLLDQQPGALKYLRVLEERPTLPNWLSYSPQTYRNLLIVGEIYSTLRGVEQVLSYLAPLEHLPRLKTLYIINKCEPAIEESLDIWRNRTDGGLFINLGNRHSNLISVWIKTVLVQFWNESSVYHIWHRSPSGAWRSWRAPKLAGWQALED